MRHSLRPNRACKKNWHLAAVLSLIAGLLIAVVWLSFIAGGTMVAVEPSAAAVVYGPRRREEGDTAPRVERAPTPMPSSTPPAGVPPTGVPPPAPSPPASPQPDPLLPLLLAAAEPVEGGRPTVAQLLLQYHPVRAYSNASLPHFVLSLATKWFGGDHPAFNGTAVCPASSCTLTLLNAAQEAFTLSERARGHQRASHVLLFHMDRLDFVDEGQVSMVPGGDVMHAAPVRGGHGLEPHLVHRRFALFAGETFDMLRPQRPDFSPLFNAEVSFRPSSIVRESYVTTSLHDTTAQGVPPLAGGARAAPAWSLHARVWADVWPPPLPFAHLDADVPATWATHYCTGSVSGREDFVRALLAHNLTVLIFGDAANCLRNAPHALNSADRSVQHAEMRRHPFHLAFENARVEGYVTEKFYSALLRGQVPVVWGAPDIARHAPGPGSYIDASLFVDKPGELAALLHRLARDEGAYAAYQAWRTGVSFAEYGDILRDELVELVWLRSATGQAHEVYACKLCHGLRRYAQAGGFAHPLPRGIPSMASGEGPRGVYTPAPEGGGDDENGASG